jgi:hypothetical protein
MTALQATQQEVTELSPVYLLDGQVVYASADDPIRWAPVVDLVMSYPRASLFFLAGAALTVALSAASEPSRRL